MPKTSSSGRRQRVISAVAIFASVAVTGLAIGLSPRGNVVAQASSESSVPVTVHIGNASGKAQACKAMGVAHIFLTIKDIQAHQSGKGNAGFHDLTPGIPAGGVQVDLLDTEQEGTETPGEANQCILADVDGGTSGLPAGKYQQFRLFLVTSGNSNSSACDNGEPNCVEFNNNTFAPLTVPSGAIKIPSSQIAHGGLTISPNQGGVDLDIDINGCASIVVRGGGNGHGHGHGHHGGGGTLALKPVLHSGAISLNPLIAGNVVLGAVSGGAVAVPTPTTAVSGATVLLEQPPQSDNFTEGDPAPTASALPSVMVEDTLATATTDANGHFVFCPVPAGTYDIVAGSGTPSGNANASDATITTGVNVGDHGGPTGLVIPLLPGSSAAVTLDAQFTSQNPSATPTPATINFGVSQAGGSNASQARIPLYSGTSDSPVTTDTGSTCPANKCPANTDCACVMLFVPEDNPVIGAMGGPYATPAPSPAVSVLGTAGTCTPANLITSPDPQASPLPTPTLSFVNCQ